MKTTPHPDIDWALLVKKVHAVALNLFRKQQLLAGDASVLRGLGISPSDLRQAAMLEFFKYRERYDATTEDQCFAVIVTIMKRDFLDAVTKLHAYTKTDDLEEEALREKEESLLAVNDGLNESRTKEVAEQFYKYAGGDQELKDVIDAAAIIIVEQEEKLQRDDIAQLLGVEVKTIKNRNERLKKRFHELNGDSET